MWINCCMWRDILPNCAPRALHHLAAQNSTPRLGVVPAGGGGPSPAH